MYLFIYSLSSIYLYLYFLGQHNNIKNITELSDICHKKKIRRKSHLIYK